MSTLNNRMLSYKGRAFRENDNGDEVLTEIEGEFKVVDTIPSEPEVGILNGCVVVQDGDGNVYTIYDEDLDPRIDQMY